MLTDSSNSSFANSIYYKYFTWIDFRDTEKIPNATRTFKFCQKIEFTIQRVFLQINELYLYQIKFWTEEQRFIFTNTMTITLLKILLISIDFNILLIFYNLLIKIY